MENIRYIIIMLLIVIVELVLALVLFSFGIHFKFFYTVFSLALFLGILFYLNYSSYREKIKIKDKKEVQNKYLIAVRNTALVILIGLGSAIFLRGISMILPVIFERSRQFFKI